MCKLRVDWHQVPVKAGLTEACSLRQEEASSHLHERIGRLEELASGITKALDSRSSPGAFDLGRYNHTTVTSMQQCLSVAYAVRHKVATQATESTPIGKSLEAMPELSSLAIRVETEHLDHPPADGRSAGSVAADEERDESVTTAPTVTCDRDGSDGDPEPGFDDSIPSEVLNALLKNFERHVENETEAGRHARAEELQRRAIEYATMANEMCGTACQVDKMQRNLASILNARGMLKESAEILCSLLRPRPPGAATETKRERTSQSLLTPERRMERAMDYNNMAKVHLQMLRSQAERNPEIWRLFEKYAKRSFILLLGIRHENESDFTTLVRFLVEAYTGEGHVVEAETYSTLYLGQSGLAASSGAPRSPYGAMSSAESASPPSFFPPVDLINSRDSGGMTPLIAAILEGDRKKVDGYLEYGADVELSCRNGRTPLLHAVDRADEALIIKLKAWHAEIEAQCHGMTILHHAIAQGSVGTIELLLDLRADVEARNAKGQTPLIHAVELNRADMVHVLCSKEVPKRASLDARYGDGWTALHLAAKNNQGAKVAEKLLMYGANPNEGSSNMQTALHCAVSHGNDALVELLLQDCWDSDIEAKDTSQRTPFVLAAKLGKYAVAKKLIEKDAKVDRAALPKQLPRYIEQLVKESEKAQKKSAKKTSTLSTGRRQSQESQSSSARSPSISSFLASSLSLSRNRSHSHQVAQ